MALALLRARALAAAPSSTSAPPSAASSEPARKSRASRTAETTYACDAVLLTAGARARPARRAAAASRFPSGRCAARCSRSAECAHPCVTSSGAPRLPRASRERPRVRRRDRRRRRLPAPHDGRRRARARGRWQSRSSCRSSPRRRCTSRGQACVRAPPTISRRSAARRLHQRLCRDGHYERHPSRTIDRANRRRGADLRRLERPTAGLRSGPLRQHSRARLNCSRGDLHTRPQKERLCGTASYTRSRFHVEKERPVPHDYKVGLFFHILGVFGIAGATAIPARHLGDAPAKTVQESASSPSWRPSSKSSSPSPRSSCWFPADTS